MQIKCLFESSLTTTILDCFTILLKLFYLYNKLPLALGNEYRALLNRDGVACTDFTYSLLNYSVLVKVN